MSTITNPDVSEMSHEEIEGFFTNLVSFRFVKLSHVRQWRRFKRCQDLQRDEYELRLNYGGDIARIEPHLYFISHRWITPEHPDPDGSQLRRVQTLSDDEALLFYDYCALPQQPRDENEQFFFHKLIKELNDLVPKMKVLVLEDPGYMTRSWCLMEYFISAFQGCLVCDEVRDHHLLKLQAIANTINPPGRPRSEIAAFEAARANEMGQIAHWFFRIFQDSKVTNGSDRQYIKDVLRSFLAKYVAFHYYDSESQAGWWFTRRLKPDEVDRILRGEEVNLVELPGIPLPTIDRLDRDVPRSLNEGGGNSFLSNRYLNLYTRFIFLNDQTTQIENLQQLRGMNPEEAGE